MNQISTAPRGLRGGPIVTRQKHQTSTGGRKVALLVGLLFLAALVVGIIVPTGLEVPERDTSTATLLTILRSNLVLLVALASCSGLQHFSQQEMNDGKKPWIRRITDLVVAVFLTLNVFALGFALGQLGMEAVMRVVPHAWLEIPAFGLGVWGYLQARRNLLSLREGAFLFTAAAVMLIVAAPIETYVSGSIR